MISELIAKDESNFGSIPRAVFISSIKDFVGERPINQILENTQILYRKYRLMEASIKSQQESLVVKLPDIESALETVRYRKKILVESTANQTFYFPLADNILVRGLAEPSDKIYLWLGANTVLEYNLDEAADVLASNLAAAEKTVKFYQDSLDFIREQLTILDVNTARIHNYGVTIQKSK
ncbi:prefoldin subunit family protein [Cryptosporidium muris RN66]|uniref:Prefoldin subunit 3 n=1 Tax=Cryptosporidium muris (strain RN66) TaxID=441375 RepID=B6A9Y5_CRYMR|nr:prefoldin subunit family protein [Cryptosporidium muris RN66]EEA05026.1 prefoldin subunit family protein [Cryptosporidium muris RN66]|eukprot:XP_002139375.1 prefoldin subunit family protein [Cryptosporidium muris RN66]